MGKEEELGFHLYLQQYVGDYLVPDVPNAVLMCQLPYLFQKGPMCPLPTPTGHATGARPKLTQVFWQVV